MSSYARTLMRAALPAKRRFELCKTRPWLIADAAVRARAQADSESAGVRSRRHRANAEAEASWFTLALAALLTRLRGRRPAVLGRKADAATIAARGRR